LSSKVQQFSRLALGGLAENVLWMELNGIDLSTYPTPNYGDKA